MSGFDGVLPTFTEVDQEVLRRALIVAEESHDFAVELLAHHDTNLGRELRRHKDQAMQLELSINRAKMLQSELRAILGWPEVAHDAP